MPFSVGCGYFPATISNERIQRIVSADTPPEMSHFEKIKEFFCSTNQSAALECLRKICHPPRKTSPTDVKTRFEQLKALAYPGFAENVQYNRNGINDFCILDENSQEILSVTISAQSYTVECQGQRTSHACDAHLTKQPRSVDEYEAIWSAWEKDAPYGSEEKRSVAVQRMRRCLLDSSHMLNLSRLNLTTLPEFLPTHIKYLFAAENKLIALPEKLPDGLQQLLVRCNQLTILPEVLPAGLTELNVGGNQLTALPEILPAGLRKLYASRNQLSALPLALPAGLTQLFLNNNRLTALPEILPARLNELEVDANRLEALPELPASLGELHAASNLLTHLPESIVHLGRGIVVLEGNPLAEQTIQTIQTITCAPRYRGPQFIYSLNEPQPRSIRALHLSVADWLTASKQVDDRWRAFEQEENAAAFSGFLDYLRVTQNNQKNPQFKAQIAGWLNRLADDSRLREQTFAVAMDATTDCEDKVTLTYHQMQSAALAHDAQQGAFDRNLPALILTGREMFRLEQLEQIARNKVKTLKDADEIDVYLGYQNRLREPLELTTTTKEMRFFAVAKLEQSDLLAAEKQVKGAENNQFGEWFALWDPWQKVLARTATALWDNALDKRADIYEKEFAGRVRARMDAVKLKDDPDAERIFGVEEAKAIDREIFTALTDSVLADKDLSHSLKACWPVTTPARLSH